ncbi:unnamed protein product [Acanthoscelides obtectus]|uniref:Uncharacterized protein n=1 Tax=Acanthoscelides obtectus TaxID=200917 RepID=A0A9P0LAE0_ACAOB|nr:unnamed protein product [Acanthoscelides obtectus]CAK1646888.1 hypothetical protein AOBTE_LOCUS14918 [Acanthoscelides obtectus]
MRLPNDLLIEICHLQNSLYCRILLMRQLGDRDCYYYVVFFCLPWGSVQILLASFIMSSILFLTSTIPQAALQTVLLMKFCYISSMHSMSDSLFSTTTFIVRILKFQRVVAP